MSDEQAPVWAQAMEARAEARADAMEQRLIVEMSKAIADSEAHINRRLDEIRYDIGVNMARADLAHTKIDVDRAEVGPKPPETA